jgi:hypothetical protein
MNIVCRYDWFGICLDRLRKFFQHSWPPGQDIWNEDLEITAQEQWQLHSDIRCQMRDRSNNCAIVRDENTSTEAQDDVKGSLYEESVCEVDQFFWHKALMIHEDFKVKAGQEIILKLATSNDSLCGVSNNNGMILMRFNISKILIVKSTPLPYRDVYKHSWIFNWITYNQIDHILIYKNNIFKCNSYLNVYTDRPLRSNCSIKGNILCKKRLSEKVRKIKYEI